MGAVDWVLLALIGAYAVFAARRLRKPRCDGNCGVCRGCKRTK